MADSSNSMAGTADVGARYAQALFDLADDKQIVAVVEQDVKSLKAMSAESPDLRRLIASPTYAAEDKGKALLALAAQAKFNGVTKKFIGLLAANNRVAALPAAIRAFEALAAARRGSVAAEVTSAVPLSKDQLSGLSKSLRQVLGKDPELSIKVDPTILGGLKVKVGSRLYDSSLRSRLDNLKHALKRA
ncbi:F0F1 ATP synthase subunit delta [soil metagenome]